ncbi:hypothetical protein FGF1_40000 [Flavobacteriaceae bacterium GF1]
MKVKLTFGKISLPLFGIVVTLLLLNCSKSEVQIDDDKTNANYSVPIDSINITTADLDEAKSTFELLNTNQKSNKSGLNLSIDIHSLRYENLVDTEAKLIVADAKTSFDNLESEVWQLEIEDKPVNVVSHYVSANFDGEEEAYTGVLAFTDFDGGFIEAYFIEQGKIIYQLDPSTYVPEKTQKNLQGKNPEPCWGIACGITLPEIVLTPRYNPGWTTPTISPTQRFQQAITINPNNKYTGYAIGYTNYISYLSKSNVAARITSTGLTGTEKCIHDKLHNFSDPYNTETFIVDLISQFKGESKFDVDIVSKDKVYDNGKEVNGLTRYKIGSTTITIEINSSRARTRSVLSVARTILHEYIHAEMFAKIYSSPPSGTAGFLNTYNMYKSKIWKPSGQTQHNTMADLYVNELAKALKSFHRAQLPGEYNYMTNNGTRNMDDFYEALAWQGLKEHGVQAWVNLPKGRQEVLENELKTHIHGLTKNCPK